MKQKKKKIIKKVEKPLTERVRLEGLVSDLSKTRNHLEHEVRHQTDELKIRNDQLRQGESKQKFAEEQIHILTKAIESTTDGIFLIDATKPDFPLIYTNLSFQKITGYAKKDTIGQGYFSLNGVYPDVSIVQEIKNTLHQGKSFHGEMLNFKRSGEKYWNLLRITPVRDGGGVVTHYIGIKTDVTLMRQKNSEIEEQREQLLHVTRVGKLAEFVSSLAHEISQPLTAILSYAQAA